MAYIYKILNKINEKYYIGSTNNIERRFSQHKYMLKRNEHHSTHLQRAWNKYGKDNFEWIILRDDVNDDERLYIEQQYLDDLKPFYPNGYNISKVAECGGLLPGEKHPKSTLTNEEVINIKKMISEGVSQKEIVENYNYTWGVIGKIASLSRWKNIGEEYNEKLKELKRVTWEDWMTDKIVEMKNNKCKTKEIAEELGVSENLISNKYRYYVAKQEGRVKQCISCGTEIVSKRKNGNHKYCKKCAKVSKNKKLQK